MFDVGSQQRLPVPEVQGLGVVSVNPAGTRAALLTSTSLQVWDVATGRLLNRLDGSHGNSTQKDEEWSDTLTCLVFHRDGDLLAFVASRRRILVPALVLWDTALGKIRSSIQDRTGTPNLSPLFSAPTAIAFSRPRRGGIWDWRIGKELFALSGHSTDAVAASPDGVTIATAGWTPSLRIAKALPWNKLTQRDGDFYRAVDDLWTYTARASRSIKAKSHRRRPPAVLADEAEILGDIKRRRGQAAEAIAHYNKAIEIRQRVVLARSAEGPVTVSAGDGL